MSVNELRVGRQAGPRALLALVLLVGIAARAQPAAVGQWTNLFPWPDNATHANLLPTGKLLTWNEFDPKEFHLWDPATGNITIAAFIGYNAFCSGHALLADGRLLVSGGHIATNTGLKYASVYDPVKNTWTRLPDMNAGRWYPTNTALPNGDMLVIAGSITQRRTGENMLPQVWQPKLNSWRDLTGALRAVNQYPWMFVAPNGKVFMAGPDPLTGYLDTSGTGAWDMFAPRAAGERIAGSAVMYDDGKVMACGGGEVTPTNMVEVIDLNVPAPAWRTVQPMKQGRVQHTTTLLPDGTVLVTGGSSGPGKDDDSSPVLATELWDPATEKFTVLAPSAVYRGYHSTALLLPDARVLSTGGQVSNDDAQIFSPPYLFKGPRPTIGTAPTAVGYGETFTVATPDAASIAKVTWLRPGTPTHGFNQNQRINRLSFTKQAGQLQVTAPANSNLSPPGDYMLFILTDQGVPSVASWVKVGGPDMVPPPEVPGVGLGELWKFEDRGNDPGQGWTTASFDDSRWKSGQGGFATSGAEAKTVLQPPDGQATVYFRKKLLLRGAAVGGRLKVQHDDGVAVWLNGTRVFARNVDGGTDHATWASTAADQMLVSDAPIPAGILVEGENQIAVMVKRVKPTAAVPKPDLRFDLEMGVNTRGKVEPAPMLSLTAPNGGETLQGGTTSLLAWSTVGSLAEVKLEVSADGGGSWQTIAEAMPNGGSYAWRVPQLGSEQVLVRVMPANAPGQADTSDAPFTITACASCEGPDTIITCGTPGADQESCGPGPGPGGPSPKTGCGASATGAPPTVLGLLLALGVALRRRARRSLPAPFRKGGKRQLGAALTAVMLLVAVTGTSGCNSGEGGAVTVEVRGAVLVGPRDLGFGMVPFGQFRDERVTFQNTSRVPVTVSRLSSNMMTVKVLDGGEFTLAGGQEREVMLRFTPAVEGVVKGHLVAVFDLKGEKWSQRVDLRGTGVRSYVEVRPKLLEFGRVELDTVKVLPVEVHNPTRADALFTVGIGGSDPDAFSVPEVGQEVRVGPGETRQLPIAFRPQRLGLAQGTATIARCSTCTPEVVTLRGEGAARMLEIVPSRLDFGRVALGAQAEQHVTLRNTGNEPATFLRAWTEGGEASYSVVNPPPQTGLRQGQSVDIAVVFQPSVSGSLQGLLRLEVQEGSAPARTYTVALTGVGGSSCVTFVPRALDFGSVPVGMSLTRDVYAFNTCQQEVTLTDVAVRTTQGGFFSLATAATSVVIPKGDKVSVPVAFGPEAGSATSSEGQLTATVRQGSTSGVDVVALKGNTREFAPCQYRVDPATLPVGRVQVGSTVTLGVALTNVGTEDCFVSRMGLASGSDPAFSTDGFQGGVLAPGARSLLAVRFSPGAMGSASGRVEGAVNHPTQGRFTVPVSGEGVQACLTLEPGTVEFGIVKRSCGERLREVRALNRCNAEVTISAAMFELATSGDLRAAEAPNLPYTLDPGDEETFTLGYAPTDEGEDTAAFRVTSPEQGTLTVGLHGSGLDTPSQSDRFVQVVLDQVDVLLVIDNSASMGEEQQNLGQNFAAFLSAAQSGGVDYHIGVTTTGINESSAGAHACAGGVAGGEAGRLFPADNSSPRIITPSTPNAAAVFAYNTNVGVCPQIERGLEAAYRALSPPLVDSVDAPGTPQVNDGNAGFLRPDARLALVFVTDEEDLSPNSVSFYATFLRGLKGNDPNLLSISAIIGPPNLSTCPTAASSGSRYLALAQATGGAVESICTADWARSLKKLSDATFSLKTKFPLSQTPVDPAQISVRVDGAPVTSGWVYDRVNNSIEFVAGSLPPAGVMVEVSYPLGC
ncbi:MAG: choice-of-anchor D domain-containing protein [Myxococcaceae bacterium]|nr:choice-of-anchor D domain-containing protein [Myxococcaceae bacterium]